ncbi:MAG: hypothetical protein J7L51_03970 [Desulfurococcales archaeon]|nr:hypothetical protein [Desulfurococcales archaeon]
MKVCVKKRNIEVVSDDGKCTKVFGDTFSLPEGSYNVPEFLAKLLKDSNKAFFIYWFIGACMDVALYEQS